MPENLNEKMRRLGAEFKAGRHDNILPWLFLVRYEGQIFNLEDHFQFEPLFRLRRPKRRVIRCARQVGKTCNLSVGNFIFSQLLPYYHSLIVCPLFSQTKRFSVEYIQNFLKNSPFRFQNSTCSNEILLKEYISGSRQTFSYAFRDVDRIRSISNIAEIIVDEVQDIDFTFIPVIGETSSAHKKYGFYSFSGTPKTTDNTMQKLFEDSSQGHWVTECDHCGYWNTAALAADLMKMIGRRTCVCARCDLPINPATGHFEHLFPEKRSVFEGYHISQVTHPRHYAIPMKWHELRLKVEKQPKFRVYNEVLGEPCDNASKPITKTELLAAATGNINTLEEADKALKGCYRRVMGIDWGGGGEDLVSYTTLAVSGIVPGESRVRTVYMKRFEPNIAMDDELNQVLMIARKLGVNFIAHDFNNDGRAREVMLIQKGWSEKAVIPYSYNWMPRKPVIEWMEASKGSRSCYLIDKARSVFVLLHMIRRGEVLLPRYDTCLDFDGNNLLDDFLNLTEERRESDRGADMAFIGKELHKPDDNVHSVNFAASSLWYMEGKYPALATPYDNASDQA